MQDIVAESHISIECLRRRPSRRHFVRSLQVECDRQEPFRNKDSVRSFWSDTETEQQSLLTHLLRTMPTLPAGDTLHVFGFPDDLLTSWMRITPQVRELAVALWSGGHSKVAVEPTPNANINILTLYFPASFPAARYLSLLKAYAPALQELKLEGQPFIAGKKVLPWIRDAFREHGSGLHRLEALEAPLDTWKYAGGIPNLCHVRAPPSEARLTFGINNFVSAWSD